MKSTVTIKRPKARSRLLYQYSVITRENSDAMHFDSYWWRNHPEWNVFVRSDVPFKDYEPFLDKPRLMGNGGASLAEAKESLEAQIRMIYNVKRAVGSAAEIPIDQFPNGY